MNIIDTLCERLSQVGDGGQSSYEKLILIWIDTPIPLSPWETWTLLFLVRHRARQQFVADTITRRLDVDIAALATMGSLGHPDCSQQGVVPGMINWEYYFHGRGCCLTNRVSGEAIDVDFFDSTADWFDGFFLTDYLESLSSPDFVEERVVSLHASGRTLLCDLDGLLEAGLLEQHEGHGGMRLTFACGELDAQLDSIEKLWPDATVRNLAAHAVSDWLLAEMSTAHPVGGFDLTMARSQRRQRANRLVAMFQSNRRQPEALWALSDLDAPALRGTLADALNGEVSGITSAALEIVDKRRDPRWCGPVRDLMFRTDVNGQLPSPFVWLQCAEILLRHGQQAGISLGLRRIQSQSLGDAAILALKYVPSIAVELFAKALRSKIPCNRITAAAALAIIDTPWSRRELATLLSELKDHVATAECRSALLQTHSMECHQLVQEWEAENCRESDACDSISMEDMRLRASDLTIQYEMADLHDRVLPLRLTDVSERDDDEIH